MAAGDGGEVGISQFQGYAPSLFTLLAQLAADPLAEKAQCCHQQREVSGILAEGGFVADGLGDGRGCYFSVINAASVAPQNLTRDAKMAFKGG